MGGVDRNDQLRQYYCLNARGYKAYMYIFYFVTDIVITNTYQRLLPQLRPPSHWIVLWL